MRQRRIGRRPPEKGKGDSSLASNALLKEGLNNCRFGDNSISDA